MPSIPQEPSINWAVINGEKETGVTTFFLQHEIDTGKIIFQEKVEIRESETAGELYDELMVLGANVMRKLLTPLPRVITQMPQDHIRDIKHAPKIFKEGLRNCWQKDCSSVYNFVRGLCPYPAAYTLLNGKVFKIYSARKIDGSGAPGTYKTDGSTYLHFYCSTGAIEVLDCQMEGKKKMSVGEFLRGYKLL